jgi:DNA polymerase-4
MSPDSQRAIIHVDMDAFYASVEQRDNPTYSGRPVIVGGLGPRGVVAAASYEAREFGVFSAMPMARARQLCPDGTWLKPRMNRYREVSSEIFAIFRSFTPLVEGLSLDEAFLDVTGSLRLLGGIRQIGRKIQLEIEEKTGLQASIGMAHNKFLAKLASDARKPHGFMHVMPDEVRAFLDPMPIGRLWGIGKKTAPKLKGQGIYTIGQLRKSEPEALRSVLGNRTEHFFRLARGEDERTVEPEQEDKSISHEITFDQDVRDARELHAELQRQALAVMHRVRKQRVAARTVRIKVRDHRFRTITRSVSMRAATTNTRTVYKVAGSLLDRWLDSHGGTPVRLIGVGVTGLEHDENPQTGIDLTLDEIAKRYGEDKITRALALERNKGRK